MRLRPLAALLLVFAIGTHGPDPLRGQAAPATGIIDIIVTDGAGAPVSTLQSQDLMLRIDGRVQPIVDLRLIKQDGGVSALPAPYASNQSAAGRTIAIAADVTRFETGETAKVREAVGAIVETLSPRDRIGIVALASDGLAADYTTRRDVVRAATDRLSGVAPPLRDAKALETAAVASLAMLERFCTTLTLDSGHKTLVFIAPPFAPTSATRKAVQSVAAVTAAQRIQFVIVDPRGGGDTASNGLSLLASATGGTLLAAPADLSTRLGNIAGRSATRYEVRFTLTDEQRDDKIHRLQVVSLRKDAVVTAPTQLHISRTGTVVDALAALADMLRQPRQWNSLPLRLAVFPVLDVERDRLRLLVLGEAEEPMTALAWAEFALIAPSGSVVAMWKAETADLATRPIMTAVLAPPGAYRLRMAASELTGRRGTVDYEFDARLTPAGALTLGPLMFGGISNQAFLPFLQFPADAKAVMGYAEIYGAVGAGDKLTSSFEVAATIDGPSIATYEGTIRTTPDEVRRAALGTIDLTPLAPGDYLVRAIVSINGKEIGRVTRTLRKAAQ
jgi:VWFA-related protein